MSNYNTISQLEKQERFAEAGYGRLFAYDKLRFNAMIDARTKAKFIREMTPETTEQLQKGLFYSGPATFVNHSLDIKNHKIAKMDLKSAYLAYLINDKIKKPGIFRIKHHGAYPLTENIQLYVIQFSCKTNSPFVSWYLNQAAIQKKKVRSDGNRIYGTIALFSSTWMNQLRYVRYFLEPGEAEVIKTYSFHGKKTVDVKMQQIKKLYQMKELGVKEAKLMLVQSTGWLSIIDKPTYYHMVQYIKFYLMETAYKYGFENDIFGNQTDCILYRVCERTKDVHNQIINDKLSLGQRTSSIGTYTIQFVDYDDLVVNKARVVLKDA
jgi:hypothetical protein